MEHKGSEERTKGRREAPPLPADASLLSFEDVAAYLRLSPAAIRTLIKGRTDGSDGELGDLLRSWLVTITPRRRYIKRAPLMAWMQSKVTA